MKMEPNSPAIPQTTNQNIQESASPTSTKQPKLKKVNAWAVPAIPGGPGVPPMFAFPPNAIPMPRMMPGMMPPNMPPPPRMKKLDIYEFDLNFILGEGSSGTVYFGFNTQTRQPVCIKIIDYLALKSQEERAQIDNEIKCLKLFKTQEQTKHILRLIDVLQSKEFCYIVLEFCEAGDLFQMLHRLDVTEKQVVPLMKGIAEALVQLKTKNIIHRDLKPSNVMLKKINGDLVPKLADFGFAALHQEAEKDTVNMGSPLYMSPEVLLSNKYTFASEVFAFGIMFYEALHKVTPWESKTESELVAKIQDPNFQITFKEGLSENLKQLILGCIKKQSADRLTIEQICEHPLFQQS